MLDRNALALIQDEHPERFNELVAKQGGKVDLTGAHLRAYDLRRYNLSSAVLTGAYMRNADLRGLDLRHAKLDDASLKDAKVSGVRFPDNLPPEEISLSLIHGTRLRHRG